MELELKIISATDLTKPNPLSKLRPYVVVSITGAAALPAQETPVDSDGGRNPNWNHPIKFFIPAVVGVDNLTLKFRIHHRSITTDKLIGEVCVPLQELLNSDSGRKIPLPGNFVSYQVKKPTGRPNGILTFSYRFNHKISGEATAEKPGTTSLPADVYPWPKEELFMNFPTKPHITSVVYPPPADVYPPPADVYPPLVNPIQLAVGYPAVETYNYDVYPPPARIPATGQMGYGYPAHSLFYGR